ncbi:MAG: nuclear transport factor 2 family protein [Pseudacidovorax sp.]|nr:nuclear transport factor 2 family protein [Pseudacidovorax sp.]
MTNLQTIQALYAGFATGDMPAILANMADDIQWTEAEGYPYAGTYQGPQAIVDGVFIKLATEWDGYQAMPERYVSEGDDVVALGHYSGTYKAAGKSFRAPFCACLEGAGRQDRALRAVHGHGARAARAAAGVSAAAPRAQNCQRKSSATW